MKKLFFLPFFISLFITNNFFAQGIAPFNYNRIKELYVEPVSDKNYSGEETIFELKIPDIKSNDLSATIPDLPANVSFVSMRRTEYIETDKNFGAKIELWLNFAEAGVYNIKSLRVTVSGRTYSVPFRQITISENPKNLLPILIVEFENGRSLVSQRNSASYMQKTSPVFSVPVGTHLKFTVYLQYALQVVNFYWEVPRNSLFTELKRYENVQSTRQSGVSDEKIPIATFEWQPLVLGNAKLPPLTLVATSFNGNRIELSMPDSFIEVIDSVSKNDSFSKKSEYFKDAFTDFVFSTENETRVPPNIADCIQIAKLRIEERRDLPFGKAAKTRFEFEKSLGIMASEKEPIYFVRNLFLSFVLIAIILLLIAIILKKISLVVLFSTFAVVFFVLFSVYSARLSVQYCIFTGGGVRSVPEEIVTPVESIESGMRVRIEYRSGGWVYISIGNSGGWTKEKNVILIDEHSLNDFERI